MLSHVWLLGTPMDCSLPCFSVHGILQARIMGWGAISFSRGSSQPVNWTQFPALQADSLLSEPPWKPQCLCGNCLVLIKFWDPGGSGSKEPACQCRDRRDTSSIPESGRSSGERHRNPLQNSCLENPMNSTWWATVHSIAKSQTQGKWLRCT